MQFLIFNSTFFQLGPLSIHWYGLTAALALITSFFYLRLIRKYNHSQKITIQQVDQIFFAVVVWGIIGARFYHVLNEWPFYLKHPLLIPAVWQGGLAIHGGVISGAIVLSYYSCKLRLSFWQLGDIFAPVLLLAQAIGRWGNFFNQELFGCPTNLPWKIFIAPENRPSDLASFNYFHPVFLYESLWGLLMVCFLTFWIIKKRPARDGLICGVGLFVFGLGRFLVELLRVDAVPVFWGARLPFLVSGLLIIAGIGIVFGRVKKFGF